MASLLELLEGGDLRSIGQSNLVVKHVLENPDRLPELMKGLKSSDAKVRMRSADALEKIGSRKPDFIQPHKKTFAELTKLKPPLFSSDIGNSLKTG